MKKTLKSLLAVAAVAATVGSLVSCESKMDPVKTRYEAEKAVFNTDPENSNRMRVEAAGANDTVSEDESVGYFTTTDDSIQFNIVSDRDAKECTLTFALASANMNAADSTMGDVELAEEYTLTVNDKEISLEGIVVVPEHPEKQEGESMPSYKQFAEYSVKANLKKGENKIILTKGEGATGVNIDYLDITAGANLSWTETDNSAQ